MTGQYASLGHLVRAPHERFPWIPPAPPFTPVAPVLLPSLETLARVLEALRRL
jgi:hypothetical protein